MRKSNAKTVLVAGGAGFIGSNLCEFLISRGNWVIALDNLSTGNIVNLKFLIKHPKFRFIKKNIINLSRPLGTLPRFWGGGKLNEIYHLASPASPPRYQKLEIATWQANTLGTLNLLELAKQHKAKFLFASTSEVYGDPKVHPQTESYWGNVNPVGIRACYDESKRAGESLVMSYVRQFKLEAKVVRIFNTYGPKMDSNDGRVVSNFINQTLQNKPITIYGKGMQTRSFMYIDDLVLGLTKMMQAKFSGPINLGNPEEFTILELAKKILRLTKSSSKLVYKPLPQDDPKQRKPDITLAKKMLDWQPQIQLNEGLIKTINYFSHQ
jgi:UDP-glucuronate decarboxylase